VEYLDAIFMKRKDLHFDVRRFEKLKQQGKELSTEETFREIFKSNHWSGDVSVSGQGSDDVQTREISIQIPKLVKTLGVKTFVDVPCGDFHWFSKMELELESYIGGDIIAEIVERNSRMYENGQRKFMKTDIIHDPLPVADLLLCRDCLVHLSFEDIQKAIRNIIKSDNTYLLTTTFPECQENKDIVTGDWRIINLEKPPFNFPKPISLINEKCTEGDGTYADKSLGLWKISEL
jgi:hypothetical protein